jgi:hypothetical protein
MLPMFARSAGNALGVSNGLAGFDKPKGMQPVAGAPKLSGGAASAPRLASPRAFKRGGVVKRGGIAKVHRGERIVSKRRFHAAKAVLGGKKKTARLIESAGHEIKNNPPKILAKTARKSGAKRANKQRVAIMLSKARAAGANIPEKG